MVYQEYLQTPEWWARRGAVMMRDDWRCQMCGGVARDVHHLTYAHVRREWMSDLVALCRPCHEKVHEDDNYAQELNKILLSNKRSIMNNPVQVGQSELTPIAKTSVLQRVVQSSSMSEVKRRLKLLDTLSEDTRQTLVNHHAQTGEWLHASHHLAYNPMIMELAAFQAVKGYVSTHSLRTALIHGAKQAKNPNFPVRNSISDYFLKATRDTVVEKIEKSGLRISNMPFVFKVVGNLPPNMNPDEIRVHF